MKVNGLEIKPYANLEEANLEGANLEEANLRRANLRRANLREAYLEGAYLEGANLREAYLEGANLRRANLREAYLEGAYLEGADLWGADLRGANLWGADLEGADLEGANLPNFQVCPEEGSFIAYKKTTKGVVKLLIPEDAKRTSNLVGRKCRADKVIVLGGEGVGGTGLVYPGLIYEDGAEVVCPDYDDDIRVEFTKGIHFFITLKEAQEFIK